MKKILIISTILFAGCYNAAPQQSTPPTIIIQEPRRQPHCPPQNCPPPKQKPQINLQFEFEQHHDRHDNEHHEHR